MIIHLMCIFSNLKLFLLSANCLPVAFKVTVLTSMVTKLYGLVIRHEVVLLEMPHWLDSLTGKEKTQTVE